MFADAVLSRTSREDFLEVLRPGPEGQERPGWPGANSIKRLEAGEFPRVPEDAEALIARSQDCYLGLQPENPFQGWLIDQVGVTSLRLDRCGRAERRMRDLAAMRAALDWDEVRDARAEAAGRGIAESPHSVVVGLRGGPHGCDWLIRRWALLGMAAESEPGWTPERVALAHDLLGTPPGARDRPPGLAFGGKGGITPGAPEPADLARREIAGLQKRKAEVIRLDAAHRAMIESDLIIGPTPELRALGRHESMLRGWLRWLIAQVRAEPPLRHSPPELYPELPKAEPEAKPESPAAPEPKPAPSASSRTPDDVEPEAEAEPESKPFGCRPPPPRIAASTRKDPREARDDARHEGRRRKREARRA